MRLPYPALDAAHGGPIATLPANRDDAAHPAEALYRVRAVLDEAPPALQETPGVLVLTARRRSLLTEWLKSGLAVLRRESGF